LFREEKKYRISEELLNLHFDHKMISKNRITYGFWLGLRVGKGVGAGVGCSVGSGDGPGVGAALGGVTGLYVGSGDGL
jgi:hypothetical protein